MKSFNPQIQLTLAHHMPLA